MSKTLLLKLLVVCVLNAITTMAHAEEEEILDEITVTEKVVANEKKPFTEAKAKSTRENLFQSSETIDTVVRSMPGAFTQQDKSSGVLSLNIRGDGGLGRTNTMIDGVTQTLYVTSTDAGRGGGSSQFGAAVDPNFIAGVDLTKGSFSGASGINSLSGAANFRTLSVDNVIQGDKDHGLLFKGLTGDNDTKSNFMLTGAVRKWISDEGYIGVLYGFSHRKVAHNYKVGGGGKRIGNFGEDHLARKKDEFFKSNFLKFNDSTQTWERDLSYDFWQSKSYRKYNDPEVFREHVAELEKSWEVDEVPQWDLTPIDPGSLQQRSYSHLAKMEYADGRNQLGLQFRTMDNHIGSRKIENRNFQINYGLTANDYLNLNFLAAHNIGKQKYPKNSVFTGKTLSDYLETKNAANIVDLNNTFHFYLPKEWDLNTTFGFNYLKNEYHKNRFPEELSLFYNYSEDQGLYEFTGHGGSNSLLPKKSLILQPSGKQNINSFYLDFSLKKDIYQLDYNVNRINYRFNGEYSGYYSSEYEYKAAFGEDSEIYKKYCNITSCDIYEPIQSKSGKKHAFNHSISLSANLSDYFMPFVTYAHTNRMPNIQEMYFSQVSDTGVNTALKPEQANTYQIGFNTFKKGIFKEDDVLGLKLVGYRSRINSYIHNVYGKWWDTTSEKRPDWVGTTGLEYSIQHRNYAKPVTKYGLELELNYDFGRFFTSLSYAYQKTNQPTSYSDASAAPNNQSKSDQIKQGYGLSKISMLPRDYGRFELGSRWLDNKLTVGSTMRYYGESKRANIEERFIDGTDGRNTSSTHDKGKRVIKGTDIIKKQPLIFDLYATYEPEKDFVIRADVQNVLDKVYIDPLDAANDSATQRYFSVFDTETYEDEEVECDDNGLCNGKYGGTSHSVLTNYARGRTFLLTFSYKF